MSQFFDKPQFSYREGGGGRVFISWQGRQVTALKGARAAAFLERVEGLDPHGQQLVMARFTGNFKRGNERAESAEAGG